MVLLGIMRWVSFGFLRTGHTHENIDQLFAQVVSRIRGSTFDEPNDVVEVLARLCRESSEQQVCLVAQATRIGQVARWKEWGDRVRVGFTGHALRGAPVNKGRGPK